MIKTKRLQIKGMHCASCASVIEKGLQKEEGVLEAEANYGTESLKVRYDDSTTSPEELSKRLEPLGYSIRQMKTEKIDEIKDMKLKLMVALPITALTIFIMVWEALEGFWGVRGMGETLKNNFQFLIPLGATYILLVVGKPYLLGLYRFIRYRKANMDTLVGLGTVAAYLYSIVVSVFGAALEPYINISQQYYDVTIVVITFITLGKYLEAKAKARTGDAIERLLNLQAKFALVVRNGEERNIPVNELISGDRIIIKPGERIPVDGVLIEGESYVDEAMVTGEPMPVRKQKGDKVVGGTINKNGAFTFRATKVGKETLLAQIIEMVEEAQASKAPIQALADKISAVFVPAVLVIAFAALGAWIIAGSYFLGFSQSLTYGLSSFVGVLVIACPCALGLATPTAIIVGVGKGAKEGILIKDAATLEKLYSVKTVVLDKTGTITKGKPTLVDVRSLSGLKEKEIIEVAASIESKSEHPIANAIVEYGRSKNIKLKKVKGFVAHGGEGVEGIVEGKKYYIGNTKLLKRMGVAFNEKILERYEEQGKSGFILTNKDTALGVMAVADEIRDGAKEAIKNLKGIGVEAVMLTGDNKKTARQIAGETGIEKYFADVLPRDKRDVVKKLQDTGKAVAMAGDGVNDAPALAQADVGIAMGTGTDVAIESAGITLLGGDISKIVKAFKLSKITMRGIKQNLFFAFVYNILGIPIAAGALYPVTGILLSPAIAGFAMAASSVSVVTNSLRIKSMKL